MLSKEEEKQHQAATVCHICEKGPFNKNDAQLYEVYDHSHFTGKYRGAAHNACNLNYQDSHDVPVVFHNLSGYDGHFLINDEVDGFVGNVHLIPLNKEKYVSFIKDVNGTSIKYKFIDSLRFMNSSLDKLASYMTDLKIVEKEFADPENFALIRRKGVYPYEYINSEEKLQETQLPPKDDSFLILSNCGISDEDYAHAQRVWQAFEFQNLLEYTLMYMKLDVLLLAGVTENFCDKSMRTYNLDPSHYYTAPGLSWDAMLKYTGIELELLEDIDMVLFIEQGIRGGLSYNN